MRKYLIATVSTVLFAITALPALACCYYVAADSFTRSGGVGPG